MSQIQGIMRTLNDFITSPRDLMIRTNQNLYTYMGKGSFITAIGARINVNKRIIRIARAGHLPVFHYKCIPKAIDIITPRGLGLGITPDLAFTKNIEEIERSFTPGDIFLFVTDGITEARDDKNQDFGFERLVEIFNNSIELDSEMIRENIVSAVKDFTSNVEQYDDLTVVVVKVK
jgi:serine phosphatase RsbU (regulator of sigma subunit)